jgi:putative acetyltransferase
MSYRVSRIVDHSRQEEIERLEVEYFGWVNGQLSAEFGITLDVDQMIAHDLAHLDLYLPPRGALLLADDGSEVAGMVFLAPIRDDTAQVRRMYVRPSHRRRGLGGRLLGEVVQAARDTGYARLVLESPRSWTGAHAVYLGAGFEAAGVEPESEVPEHLRDYWVYLSLRLQSAAGPTAPATP